MLLHCDDILSGVRIVGDPHKIVDLRRIDFFILAGNEQAGDTNELQIRALCRNQAEVSVEKSDGKE